MNEMKLPEKQQGVALAVAMILLLGVTVVSLASLNTSLLELNMAGNEQARMEAFQKAQAGLDAVQTTLCADYQAFFAPFQFPGDSSCAGNAFDGQSCDDLTLTPTVYDTDDMTNTQFRVARAADIEIHGPRGNDEYNLADANSTCHGYNPSSAFKKFATLIVESKYDAIASRGGRSHMVQGYLIAGKAGDDGPVTVNFDPSVP